MKTVVINKLRIKNFKGVKNFTFEPNGQNTNIYGKNASGKTTIQDAFTYLLFGKDSMDRADFQLKPVSGNGQEIHHLDTEIEALLDVGGKSVTLMKLYKEKWTIRRGSAAKEFSGHTTEHYIDGVPTKKKDYDARICELININAFKLVTSPFEFANLHWTGRRNMLLEICGDVSDQDVIKSDHELTPLSNILANCTVDDHRLKVRSQQKKINEKLKEIPARIAENQEMVTETTSIDIEEKWALDKDLTDLRDKLAQERNNETLSAKRVELNEANAAILKERARVEDINREGKKPILDAIDVLEAEIRGKKRQSLVLNEGLTIDEQRNASANKAIAKVREEWHLENVKQPTKDATCPTCGQALPPDQIEEVIKSFNKDKAHRLERINQEGKRLKLGIFVRDKAIADAKAETDTLLKDTHTLDEAIAAKRQVLDGEGITKPDTEGLDQKKAGLENEIEALKNGSGIRERDIKEQIEATQKEFDVLSKAQAEYDAAEKARIRIADLEKQEKELAAEYEALEKELFLTETFIRRKVALLEGSINSRFKFARFKMFDEQINGGLSECCEILLNGVPFEKGLNNSARVNTGIDIINTLSDYFQFQAPIFCDNAESINKLEDTPSQVIGLYVSTHKELTIEKNEIKKAS